MRGYPAASTCVMLGTPRSEMLMSVYSARRWRSYVTALPPAGRLPVSLLSVRHGDDIRYSMLDVIIYSHSFMSPTVVARRSRHRRPPAPRLRPMSPAYDRTFGGSEMALRPVELREGETAWRSRDTRNDPEMGARKAVEAREGRRCLWREFVWQPYARRCSSTSRAASSRGSSAVCATAPHCRSRSAHQPKVVTHGIDRISGREHRKHA